MQHSLPANSAIFYRRQTNSYLIFKHPHKIIQAESLSDVTTALGEVELKTAAGFYAAGFITYEAAPAFDSSLRVKTHKHSRIPLLWFGIYDAPEECISLNKFTDEETLSQISLCPDTDEIQYKQGIEQIKQLIAKGDTYQVNYTVRMRGDFPHKPLPFFSDVLTAGINDYSSYIETEQTAICSFSPELFFEKKGRMISSKPMKGTIERGLSSEQDAINARLLQNSQKDRAENMMIVDMVRNDMGRICKPGTISVKDIYAVNPFPNVWQMTTTIEGETDSTIGEIMKAMFPAASITGAPKTSTMSILCDLEQSPRNLYTGSIGFIMPTGDACFNVAIRTLVLNKSEKTAEYGAGGGIVWDSVIKKEYNEMWQKTQIIRKTLPKFDLLETILWEKGKGFQLLELHLNRMEKSANYFQFLFNREKIHSRITHALNPSAGNKLKIRLLLSKSGKIDIQITPFLPTKKAYLCKTALQPVDINDVFLYHKTTCRQVYDKAQNACSNSDEVILFNERNEITEGTTTNIIFLKNEKWMTPPVKCGLLPGTYRESLINSGYLTEGILLKDELKSIGELFFINSVRGKIKATISD